MGTCIKLIPLRYVAAVNPVKSPTTPPPTEEQKPETKPSENIGEQETNPNEVKPAE